MLRTEQLPPEAVHEFIQQIHTGACPKCQGPGPVDVHTSHSIYSIVVFTSWKSDPQICCRSCGVRSQLAATGTSLVLGWWGFPWGLLMTPWQISRNLLGLMFAPSAHEPSKHLQSIGRYVLGRELLNDSPLGIPPAASSYN
jgi:hypothetical protein